MKLGEDLSPEEMDKVLEEQGRLQDRIDASNAWEIDSQLELAMDALRCPPPDADVSTLSGGERRRVALCRLLRPLPICCCSTSRPTISTPSRWAGSSDSSRNTRARSSPSRTTATSSTTSPSGSSSSIAAPGFRGRGTTRPGWIRSSSAWRRKRSRKRKRHKTLQRELEWIRMSPRARQAKGKARLNAYEQLLNEDTAQKIEQVEIYIPPGPRLGDLVVEARGLRKGYGDQLLMTICPSRFPAAASSA